MWSVDLMLRAGCDPVILTLPADAMDDGRARVGSTRGVVLTEGGDTRQQSVARGLTNVATEVVVVHDAARPFATEAMIRAILNELSEADGAITAIPVDDTVKRAHDGLVGETVPREELWLSQTPQAFATDVLKSAHDKADEEGYVASDDAELVERYGGKVTMVHGSRLNIKITFPDDYMLAEAIADTL
jgi:2-C-methyl-D-erythritol 4-phosphate cytidylyltransferase